MKLVINTLSKWEHIPRKTKKRWCIYV